MIDQIDRSLEAWLRADVPLPKGDVELSFDQPEKSWDARRPVPLVNLFLYSLNKSFTRAMTGTRVVKRPDGGLARQQLVPVVEARYLVSVWGGGPGVEHEMLGRLVNILASTHGIPVAHQSASLLSLSPQVSLSLVPDQDTSFTHLWSGLGVPPRPAIQLMVYAPMGQPVPVPVPNPPSSVQLGVDRQPSGPAYAPRRRMLATQGFSQARPSVVIEDSGRDEAVRREGLVE